VDVQVFEQPFDWMPRSASPFYNIGVMKHDRIRHGS
jgi:hypothetical protein